MIKFKSVKRNTIIYEVGYNSEAFKYHSRDYLSSDVFEFDTLGDGDIQHTPSYPTNMVYALDFLISISSFILENNIPDDDLFTIQYLTTTPDDETSKINFIYKLKNVEGKRTFFNINNEKISRSESKRYDKRWTEVPSWFTGSTQDIYTLFKQVKPVFGFLEVLNRWNNINDVFYSHYVIAECLNTDSDEVNDLLLALKTFKNLVLSLRKRVQAKKTLVSLIESS
jgi:hypothetical protein